MADKNETFEFQIKANIKQLQESLKQIPSMTKEEAQKMVRALSSEMKKAQTAAKKAADESKKAARISAQEFEKAGQRVKETFADQTRAAQRAGSKMEKALAPSAGLKATRKQSRDLGAALGSLEDVVGGINPELASMASEIGLVGQGMRSLSRSLATGNVIMIGIVATLAAVAVGYTLFTREQQKAKEQFNKFQEELKDGNSVINQLGKEVDELSNKLSNALPDPEVARVQALQEEGELTRELLVLRGQMTEEQKAIADVNSKLKTDLAEQSSSSNELLLNLGLRTKKAEDEVSLLTERIEQQKEYLKTVKLDAKEKKDARDILFDMIERRKDLNYFITRSVYDEKAINADLEIRNATLTKQAAIQNQITLEKQKQEAIKSTADLTLKITEENKKSAIDFGKLLGEEISKGVEEAAKIQEVLENKIKTAQQETINQEISNRRLKISMIENESERINEQIKLDKELLDSRVSAIQNEKQQNLDLATTQDQIRAAKEANALLDENIAQLKEEQHLNEMMQSKERMIALEKETKKREQLAFMIGQTFSDGARATADLIKAVSKEDKEAALVAFRISQAAAVTDIIMTTAKKVMEVAPNPVAMGIVGGIGAVQAATVLAQSPPEMHTGGMITKGEDTKDITVLTGEAVLNRRTVQNLGGEEGVNRLQRTGSSPSPEVIIMNPFKHFDRYARASMKRGGYISKVSKKQASGAY